MERNRYVEAFKESYNVLGLAAVAAASAALLTPLPLLVGLVAEAAYILFVSDSRWYQVRLAKRFDSDVEKRRAELKMRVMPTLAPALQNRFLRLETVRKNLDATDATQPEWLREVLRKLDFLLEKFLHFAAKDAQFRQYLESVLLQECGTTDITSSTRNAPQLPPQVPQTTKSRGAMPNFSPKSAPNQPKIASQIPADDNWTNAAIARIQLQYDGELAGLRKSAQNESDLSTRAVLEKRVDVLERRREFVGKIGRIQTNLRHQLGLLEDTFGLIADEIRAQPPEQVLADIDDVVSQTKTMTQLLEEFAPFEPNLNI